MGCGCNKGTPRQRNIQVSSARGTYGNGIGTKQKVLNGNDIPTPMLRQMALKKQRIAATRKEEQEKLKIIRQRVIRGKLGLKWIFNPVPCLFFFYN